MGAGARAVVTFEPGQGVDVDASEGGIVIELVRGKRYWHDQLVIKALGLLKYRRWNLGNRLGVEVTPLAGEGQRVEQFVIGRVANADGGERDFLAAKQRQKPTVIRAGFGFFAVGDQDNVLVRSVHGLNQAKAFLHSAQDVGHAEGADPGDLVFQRLEVLDFRRLNDVVKVAVEGNERDPVSLVQTFHRRDGDFLGDVDLADRRGHGFVHRPGVVHDDRQRVG